eukprot:COSAG05_NODE_4733_length_1392_cov_0.831400_1_plen_86_part_10
MFTKLSEQTEGYHKYVSGLFESERNPEFDIDGPEQAQNAGLDSELQVARHEISQLTAGTCEAAARILALQRAVENEQAAATEAVSQ